MDEREKIASALGITLKDLEVLEKQKSKKETTYTRTSVTTCFTCGQTIKEEVKQ